MGGTKPRMVEKNSGSCRLAVARSLLLVRSRQDLRTGRELFDQVHFINGELVAFGKIE